MYNVDFLIFPFRIPPQSNSSGSSTLPQTSIAALGDAAAALQLGLPGHAHHHATPNSMHSYFNSHAATTHQDYLNCLHASAALAVDQHNLGAKYLVFSPFEGTRGEKIQIFRTLFKK